MGSRFVFDLTLSLHQKSVYTVALTLPGSTLKMFRGSSEDRVLNEIEEQRDRLENIDNEAWIFRLAPKNIPRNTIMDIPPDFNSMYELLSSLVN